jgi:3-oxoacyl-[acyl-carrier-protein] synthase III
VHYIAEPESSTKTTAEAAGTPTFRGLEQTQPYFLDILTELAQIAVQHRKLFDRRVNPESKIEAVGPDITERGNSLLALAVSRIYPAFSELYDREGISADEFLRIVYRMAGETIVHGLSSTVQMKCRPLKPVSSAAQPNGKTGSTAALNPPMRISPMNYLNHRDVVYHL